MKNLITLLSVVVLAFVIFVILWQVSKARTFQTFGRLIHRVEASRKVVALTFDDGPTQNITPQVLELLKAKGVKATFFVTGAELEMNMDRGREIVAAGHELGNHSYSHERMVLVSPSYVANEIEQTDRFIRDAGYQGEIYFRPPYCKKLVVLPYYLSQHNRTTVTWDVEPDSETELAADQIAEKAVAETRPGSIILLHVMYSNRSESFKAVPKIIDELRSRGFEFVTISELMAEMR